MSDAGQVALVTGSSSGFGKLIALKLARNGFAVFASMREMNGRNVQAAEDLHAIAARESLALEPCEMDVTDETSVNGRMSAVIAKAGRLDVLVNNAGFGYMGLTETFTLEQMRSIFETNVFGIQRTIRAALPQMFKQRSGLLLQVSSGAGRIVLPGMGLYCASKHALEALTEAYRYELASSGIDSVSLQPGAYKTEIFGKIGKGHEPALGAKYGRATEIPQRVDSLLGKTTADPQEIADATLQIIRTPFGHRKPWYRVGTGGLGVEQINALKEEVQTQLLKTFGLADETQQVGSSSASA
jgi:NAD(P)-dependent dehydrogenase (short-subunit alcohol dehydrogenase family)